MVDLVQVTSFADVKKLKLAELRSHFPDIHIKLDRQALEFVVCEHLGIVESTYDVRCSRNCTMAQQFMKN